MGLQSPWRKKNKLFTLLPQTSWYTLVQQVLNPEVLRAALAQPAGCREQHGAVQQLLRFADRGICPAKDVGKAGKPITVTKTVLLQFTGASQQNTASKARFQVFSQRRPLEPWVQSLPVFVRVAAPLTSWLCGLQLPSPCSDTDGVCVI